MKLILILVHNFEFSMLKEKVQIKEKEIKNHLELLREKLNDGHKRFTENPNDIGYYPSLVHVSNKLKDILAFFDQQFN